MRTDTTTINFVLDMEELDIQAILKLECALYPGDRGDRYSPPEAPSFEVIKAELVEVHWATHTKGIDEIIPPLEDDILARFWDNYELESSTYDHLEGLLTDHLVELEDPANSGWEYDPPEEPDAYAKILYGDE